MTVRLVKIFLALSVGVFGLIGTIGNLSGLSEVYEAVERVTTMSGIPEGVGPPWRTGNPAVIWMGVAAIVFGKLAALLSGVGGVLMIKHLKSGSQAFQNSKKWAIVGCALAFGLTFFSFTVVAESAFFMFYSPAEGGAGALAFRLSGSFALIALFIAQPEYLVPKNEVNGSRNAA
jgi:predicted small integral membrane protein